MIQYVDISWPQGNYHPGAEVGEIIAATSGDGGRLFTQATYHEDVANARAAGKTVGFYHFNGNVAAAASAEYFWAVIRGDIRAGDIVILDVEPSQAGRFPSVSPAWAAAFSTRLAQLRGLTVAQSRLGIYGDYSDMHAAGWGALEKAGCWLFLAYPGGYPENTKVGEWSHWTMLQYSSAGGVDRDESESTFAQIAGAPVTPAPEPIRKEKEMLYIFAPHRGGGVLSPTGFYPLNPTSEEAQVAQTTYGKPAVGDFTDRQWDVARQTALNIADGFAKAVAEKLVQTEPATIAAAVVAALPAGTPVDVNALATAIAAQLTPVISPVSLDDVRGVVNSLKLQASVS